MKKPIIIGTSHVSRESETKIAAAIEEHKPEFVCLELDKQRFEGLLSGQRSRFSFKMFTQYGLFGTLFVLFASMVQGQIAKIIGTQPGLDMLFAYKKASEKKARVALIDQPIAITLRHLSKRFRKRELFVMLWDTIKGFFGRSPIPIKKINVSKIPDQETIDLLVSFIKKRYPTLHLVLVHERNIYMAHKLQSLQARFPENTIVAVVGAAHKKEMEKLL